MPLINLLSSGVQTAHGGLASINHVTTCLGYFLGLQCGFSSIRSNLGGCLVPLNSASEGSKHLVCLLSDDLEAVGWGHTRSLDGEQGLAWTDSRGQARHDLWTPYSHRGAEFQEEQISLTD